MSDNAFIALLLTVVAVTGFLLVRHEQRRRPAPPSPSWRRERIYVSLMTGLLLDTPREKVAEALGRLDEWAVHNLWANVDGADMAAWRASFESWVLMVTTAMTDAGCSYLDVKQFSVLGEVDMRSKFHNDPAVNKQLCMLSQHRRRLADIVDRYSWTARYPGLRSATK